MYLQSRILLPIILLAAMLPVDGTTAQCGEMVIDNVLSPRPIPWVTIQDVDPGAAVESSTTWPEQPPVPPRTACHFNEFSPLSLPAAPRSLRWESDVEHAWPTFREDVRGVFSGCNLALLTVALGSAVGLRESVDDRVRENTARHPERWGTGSEVIGRFGEVQYQLPVLLGTYAWSLHREDESLHRLMTTMISAYTITGLTTVTIKGIANTERPSDEWNDGEFGFPSFHAASSFSLAAVLDETYGPRYGVPAYALAGLISWSRIDERDHDLSDVVFGAALGLIVGKAVAGRRLRGDSQVRLLPYADPRQGSAGWMLDLRF